MWALTRKTSPFLILANDCERSALPALIDFISAPLRIIPASTFSKIWYLLKALRFIIFIRIIISDRCLFPYWTFYFPNAVLIVLASGAIFAPVVLGKLNLLKNQFVQFAKDRPLAAGRILVAKVNII